MTVQSHRNINHLCPLLQARAGRVVCFDTLAGQSLSSSRMPRGRFRRPVGPARAPRPRRPCGRRTGWGWTGHALEVGHALSAARRTGILPRFSASLNIRFHARLGFISEVVITTFGRRSDPNTPGAGSPADYA